MKGGVVQSVSSQLLMGTLEQVEARNEALQAAGWKKVAMSGGGGESCLACTVSFHCTGSQEHHAEFQRIMVEHQRLEGEYYQLLLEGDTTLEKHLEKMANGNTAMDETEALAFAELAQCPLDIWVMLADGSFGFQTPGDTRARTHAARV